MNSGKLYNEGAWCTPSVTSMARHNLVQPSFPAITVRPLHIVWQLFPNLAPPRSAKPKVGLAGRGKASWYTDGVLVIG